MLVAVSLNGLLFAASYRAEATRRGLDQGRSEAALLAQTAIGPALDARPLSDGLRASEWPRWDESRPPRCAANESCAFACAT
jgi:hypothetical protein